MNDIKKKVKILDVGWFRCGEEDSPFLFYIELVVDNKKATIHSYEQYNSRSKAIKSAHEIIAAFGWKYDC